MGQHVVELLGHRQPLRVASPIVVLLLNRARSQRRPLIRTSSDTASTPTSQPATGASAPSPGRSPRRVHEGRDGVAGVPGDGQQPGSPAPAGLDGRVQGDDHAQEDRAVRVPQPDVDVDRGQADRRRDERPPVPPRERQRAGEDSATGRRVDGASLRLVARRAERADELEHPDPDTLAHVHEFGGRTTAPR